MHGISNIFIIGNGPSSSHTMGPSFACDHILETYQNIEEVTITLYGSLALTGKGHLTDVVIHDKFKDIPHKIVFDLETPQDHPNTMTFETKHDGKISKDLVVSLGGGSVLFNGYLKKKQDVYEHSTLSQVMRYCIDNNKTFFEYIKEHEPPETFIHMHKVYDTMWDAIRRGQSDDSILPGRLQVMAKAKMLLEKSREEKYLNIKKRLEVMSAAYAVAEENARGHIVVTAPTCGSCGVIPGVMVYMKQEGFDDDEIFEALCVAGLFGRIIKTNGTVSGAVAGCQAEIGSACAMAAAMCNYAFKNHIKCVAQAAEIALEHSLGLTCDPVDGYVQIPCIERNAIFAQKAIDSSVLGACIDPDKNKIIFDDIIKTMVETGDDMGHEYKETSKKGLAKLFRKEN